jgi:hypothetical protein
MSCTGCNDGCFDESVQLAQGPAGSAGTNGSDGLYGGWSLKWKFDTNIGSGTGTNEVRLNNASPASATEIYVNDDAFGTGAADVFLSSVTSAPYGRIKIFKEYDSTIFWLATITAADDTTVPAEVKFTVTDVVTNGSFTDGDDIVLTLAPTGATGAAGPTGPNGVTILHYDVAQGSFSPTAIGTTNQTTATIKRAFSIPANTWETNGDMIELEIMAIGQNFEKPAGIFGLNSHKIYVDLDGNPIEMDTAFTTSGNPGYVYADSKLEPLLHLKLQLMLTDSGLKSILPITDFESNPGIYTALSSANIFANFQSSWNWNHRGVITTPGPALNAPITLNVSAVSADVSVNINMFYAKITSYKKS